MALTKTRLLKHDFPVHGELSRATWREFCGIFRTHTFNLDPIISSGASGGSLHGGVSLKVEKAHCAA